MIIKTKSITSQFLKNNKYLDILVLFNHRGKDISEHRHLETLHC